MHGIYNSTALVLVLDSDPALTVLKSGFAEIITASILIRLEHQTMDILRAYNNLRYIRSYQGQLTWPQKFG